MASTPTTTILEHFQVAPFPGSEAKLSLPLTFFDMSWINFHVIQRLLFYEFPCSNSHFIDTIIPHIKHSLSIALKHFLPLAGNLIYPLDDDDDDDNMPEILYMNGDTVSVTFAESDNDFNYLTAKHARKANKFYSLVPQLPSPILKSDCKMIPLMAVKVTVFPNVGICIGFVNHHVVGDARTIIGFMNAWASIHKLGGDEHLLACDFLPFYDRSAVKDPNGLGKIIWNRVKNSKVEESQQINYQTDKVRATYVISEDQIQMLKDRVLDKWKNLARVSSFIVTCAYVWTCLVRSRTAAAGVAVAGDDDDEYFICSVDCRERLDPPLPGNYFGNCLRPCIVRISREKLMGKEGFVQAAYSIRVAIHELVNNEGGILAGSDKLSSKLKNLRGKSVVGVAGSPKFDVYEGDYGWGKPKRYEAVSIDFEAQSMSLNKSRECDGGLEIGLSLPNTSMNAFATLFIDGFKI